MLKNKSFWIRLFLTGSAFLLAAGRARAQAAAISFDALPRTQRSDTARATKPSAKPARADLNAAMRGEIVALRDSVARLNRALADASPATRPATHVRTDTTKPTAPVPTPKAPAAASFSPASVSGLMHILVSGGDSALKSTYRIRRAEVKVVSDLGRRAQATLMIDVSKALSLTTSGTQTSVSQNSRVLQDAILSAPVGPVQIEAGQQRLPLGYEGSHSSSTLETVDRALMESDRARGASFGDVRDLGLAVRGKWRWLDYRGGVFNGSGESMNDTDKNVGKAFVGQLAVRVPSVKGLRLGSSAATRGPAAGDKPTRDRVGADLVFVRGRVHVQAEAMRGQDGALTRAGMYALAGVSPAKSLKLVTRFDAWDPDTKKETTAASVTERDYLAGVTWLVPTTRLKLQLAVARKTFTRGITPSVTQVLTQVQASW